MRARRHRQSPSPAAPSGIVPFDLSANDLIPEFLPGLPLCGTKSAPHNAFLSWHAEFDVAKLECSNAAAAAAKAAVFSSAEAKANLDTAVAAYHAAQASLNTAGAAYHMARTGELNASARSSIALEHRRTAWECYLQLLADARDDSASPLAISVSPAPGGSGVARASSSDGEDAVYNSDGEVFEGSGDVLGGIKGDVLVVDGAWVDEGEEGSGAMDLS
jgi:hypothetical protein